jgi:hypothetical protein
MLSSRFQQKQLSPCQYSATGIAFCCKPFLSFSFYERILMNVFYLGKSAIDPAIAPFLNEEVVFPGLFFNQTSTLTST